MMYHELGARPVSGSKPQGEDVRYDDLFLDLEAEINKLSSPSERDFFSWQTVADRSSSVLKDHSKDLLAASYLSVALIHLRNDKGLEAASAMFKDLLDHFWDTLYPEKKRSQGRIAALTWWIEQTERALDEAPGWHLNEQQIQTITGRLWAIDSFLGEHLSGAPPLNGLIRKIEHRLRPDTTMPTPEPHAAKQPVVSAPEPIPPVDLPPISEDNPDEAVKTLLPLFQKIKQAAKILRSEKAHNPQAYRWLRFSIWETVRALPPSVDGITRIAPPQAQTLSHLEHLLKQEEYLALLQASESALSNPGNIFLMELNLYSWSALSGLGPKYRVARDAVLHETRNFLVRLSGLDLLLFSNGTPFISEKTKEWLKNHDRSQNNNDSDIMPINGQASDLIQDEISFIRERIKKTGNLSEMAEALHARIRTCESMKDAMRLRLGLAGILASEKQEAMAAAHLEAVLECLDRHHIDGWDPALALNALKLIYKVFKNHGDSRYRSRAGEIFARIAKLNTAYAMNL